MDAHGARQLGGDEEVGPWDLGVVLDGGRDLLVDRVGVTECRVQAPPTLPEKLGIVAVVVAGPDSLRRAAKVNERHHLPSV